MFVDQLLKVMTGHTLYQMENESGSMKVTLVRGKKQCFYCQKIAGNSRLRMFASGEVGKFAVSWLLAESEKETKGRPP